MSAPDDNLPPVQPPSAGFLMQLFVVPMVIVVVIVTVCLMFNWLAHLGTEPYDLVQDLDKLNAGSWQKALTVANLLTDRKHTQLRRDEALAARVAKLLDEQLEQGSPEPDRVKLRIYLTLALGVFEVDTGLPTLVKAAQVQRDPADVEVRKTAIEALARQADASPERRERMQQNPALIQALRSAAGEFGEQAADGRLYAELRIRAAYTLGVLGGPAALELLSGLLADADPMVRFNATTGLARLGDERALPQLLAMLQPAARVSSEGEQPPLDEVTQTTVLTGALQAAAQLSRTHSDLDRQSLRAAIESLLASPELSPTVRRGIEADAQAALAAL